MPRVEEKIEMRKEVLIWAGKSRARLIKKMALR